MPEWEQFSIAAALSNLGKAGSCAQALTVYPTLIAPLFNKFESLQQGPLR